MSPDKQKNLPATHKESIGEEREQDASPGNSKTNMQSNAYSFPPIPIWKMPILPEIPDPGDDDPVYVTQSDKYDFTNPATEHYINPFRRYAAPFALLVIIAAGIFILSTAGSTSSPPPTSHAPSPAAAPSTLSPPAVFRQIDESELDVSAENRLTDVYATASNFLETDGYSYPPENVLDNNLATSWQVHSNLSGIGESITVHLGEAKKIRCITLALGNCKSQSTFYENARPRTLRFDFSDGSQYLCSFEDGPILRCISISPHISTDWVKVSVEDVYAGSTYTDLCISKINLYE